MNAADAVYATVRTIPRGRVASYGQVAGLVSGVYVSARIVGQIMASSPEDVPWQRVVASDGRLVIAKRDPAMGQTQRRLLESEGVAFLADGRVDMARYRWDGAGAVGSLFDDEG